MRSLIIRFVGVGAALLVFSCGKEAAQAPEAPRFVQEQQKKVADFKARRGLEDKPATEASINDRLALELRRVRAALSQYTQDSKSLPWQPGQAAVDGWNPLGFSQLPVNPLSPDRARSKIVEISKKGATGSNADPNEAGWVWNSADGKMFASGSDE